MMKLTVLFLVLVIVSILILCWIQYYMQQLYAEIVNTDHLNTVKYKTVIVGILSAKTPGLLQQL